MWQVVQQGTELVGSVLVRNQLPYWPRNAFSTVEYVFGTSKQPTSGRRQRRRLHVWVQMLIRLHTAVGVENETFSVACEK